MKSTYTEQNTKEIKNINYKKKSIRIKKKQTTFKKNQTKYIYGT